MKTNNNSAIPHCGGRRRRVIAFVAGMLPLALLASGCQSPTTGSIGSPVTVTGSPAPVDPFLPPSPEVLRAQGKIRKQLSPEKVEAEMKRTMQDLRELYPVLQQYRLRHNGRLPPSLRDLDPKVVSRFRSMGFRKAEDEGKDSPFAKWPVTIMDRRFDGTPVGGPKPPGTRDLWAVRFVPHMNGEPAPKAVALWEDGEVAIQAPDTMIQVPLDGKKFTIGFTGQAGVSRGERVGER